MLKDSFSDTENFISNGNLFKWTHTQSHTASLKKTFNGKMPRDVLDLSWITNMQKGMF